MSKVNVTAKVHKKQCGRFFLLPPVKGGSDYEIIFHTLFVYGCYLVPFGFIQVCNFYRFL